MHKIFATVAASLLVLALATAQKGCPKKTTFDRIGQFAGTAAQLVRTNADALLAQQKITQAKRDAIVKKADALTAEVKHYADQLAAFPVVTRENLPLVLAATDGLLQSFRGTLTDPQLVDLSPDSRLIRDLNWGITGIDLARTSVLLLFPPPPDTATTTSTAAAPAIATAPAAVPARSIVVTLPPRP